MSDIDWFDAAPAEQARVELLTLTASPAWADAMLEARPYGDLVALLVHSDAVMSGLPETEVDAALAGHPRIGERAHSLDTEEAARSAREQSGMASADDQLLAELARGNADYEAQFGRIYLVAAAGRSAPELLGLLQDRLGNDPVAELDVVRRELARITRRRLANTFGGDQA